MNSNNGTLGKVNYLLRTWLVSPLRFGCPACSSRQTQGLGIDLLPNQIRCSDPDLVGNPVMPIQAMTRVVNDINKQFVPCAPPCRDHYSEPEAITKPAKYLFVDGYLPRPPTGLSR